MNTNGIKKCLSKLASITRDAFLLMNDEQLALKRLSNLSEDILTKSKDEYKDATQENPVNLLKKNTIEYLLNNNGNFNKNAIEELKKEIQKQYDKNVFKSWTNIYRIYHTIIHYKEIKESKELLEEFISKIYLLDNKINSNYKSHYVDIKGSQNQGYDRVWCAFYKGESKSELQIFFQINGKNEIPTLEYGIYSAMDKKYINNKISIKIDEIEDIQLDKLTDSYDEYKEVNKKTRNKAEVKLGVSKYWLYAPGEYARLWEQFYNEEVMAIGWHELGDLNNYGTKEEIVKQLQKIQNTKSSKKNDATANYEFKNIMSVGDIVIVKKGRSKLLGYGKVKSDYYFDDKRDVYQKCRKNGMDKKKANGI